MRVNLSITVMTHPKRKHDFFEQLYTSLEKELLAFNQEENEDKVYLSYVSDDEGEGVWKNALNGWLSYQQYEDATHQLLLQDDVMICKDFIKTVLECIKRKPNDLIGLYCPRKIIEEAKAKGDSWVMIPDGCWGQSNILPTYLIPIFLKWCDRHIDPTFPHDDSRLSLFVLENKKYAWLTVPSLVEHMGHSKSLLNQNNKNKVAKWFIGKDVSGLSIDWDKGLKNPLKASNGIMRSHYNYFYKYGVNRISEGKKDG